MQVITRIKSHTPDISSTKVRGAFNKVDGKNFDDDYRISQFKYVFQEEHDYCELRTKPTKKIFRGMYFNYLLSTGTHKFQIISGFKLTRVSHT